MVPTSQKFWSEKKGDDSVLVINGTKLCKADKWLEENDRSEYWFEVRAHIKINGTEVFTCQSGLYGKENVEEYYINFGATLETVPGENVWLNQNLNCYVENPEHPYGELLQAKITKVKTLNKQIYSIAYLKNGWRMKAENRERQNRSYLYRYPWKPAKRIFQYFCNRCLLLVQLYTGKQQ